MSYGERRRITVINNPSKKYIFSLEKNPETKVNANKTNVVSKCILFCNQNHIICYLPEKTNL